MNENGQLKIFCPSYSYILLSYFRPLSGSVLVVGCDNGLFVWTVDPSSPVVRYSKAANNLFLQAGNLSGQG